MGKLKKRKKLINEVINLLLLVVSLICLIFFPKYFELILNLFFIDLILILRKYHNPTMIDRLALCFFNASVLIISVANLFHILLLFHGFNISYHDNWYVICTIFSQIFVVLALYRGSWYNFRKWEVHKIFANLIKSFIVLMFVVIILYIQTINSLNIEYFSIYTVLGIIYITLSVMIVLALAVNAFTNISIINNKVILGFSIYYVAFLLLDSLFYFENNPMIIELQRFSFDTYISFFSLVGALGLAYTFYILVFCHNYEDRYAKEKYVTFENFNLKGLVIFTLAIVVIFYVLGILNLMQTISAILLYGLLELLYQQSKLSNNNSIELEKNMTIDRLTGLRNRAFFTNKVVTSVNKYPEDMFSIIIFDISRFKVINDLYGHDTGDEVLSEVADRMKNTMRDNVLLSRIGGDEFAYMFASVSEEEIISEINRILAILEKPIVTDQAVIDLSASFGIAKYPDDTKIATDIIKFADNAMYLSKKNKKIPYTFHNQKMVNELLYKNKLEKLLDTINFDEEFEMYYQPQIDVKSKKIVSAEALLRWHHDNVIIPPNDFIPIAEDTGAILSISRWVSLQVTRQIIEWRKNYDTNIKLSFNVSNIDINSLDYAKYMSDLYNEFNIEKDMLTIEVTERVTAFMSDITKSSLKLLTDKGIDFSVDDFGTGYASANFLQDTQISEIKIPKELIDNIDTNTKKCQYVKLIINMAKAYEIKTVIEGVETKEQFDTVVALGADLIQGFYFDKPLKKVDFEKKYLEK